MCELGGRMYRTGTRNTFSSCPFLCFTQNGQTNVTASPPTSLPAAVLAPKGRTERPRQIFRWRIPPRSSKKTIPASTLATLPYPCTYRTSKSPTSGAEPTTAVGGPGIHQRQGQEVHDNLKDMEEMHGFT